MTSATDTSPEEGLMRMRRIYRHWGRFAFLYAAQDWITFMGRPHAIRAQAAESMNVGKGARVLEIACGTGRNFPHIQRVIGPEGHLVGLDYTPEMLAAAERQVRHRGWKNVTLVRADAAERVFEEASFDAALCVLALSGIPRHRDAIARCHEALAPGATFAVCDAQPFPGRLRALNPLIRAIYEPLAGWDADRNVPEDLRSAFGNASLRTQNFGSFFIATAKKR